MSPGAGHGRYDVARSGMGLTIFAPLAQSAEHSHGKAGVVGSIPTGGSPGSRSGWSDGRAGQGGVAQLVEHTAHNREVAGSSPAAATARMYET